MPRDLLHLCIQLYRILVVGDDIRIVIFKINVHVLEKIVAY